MASAEDIELGIVSTFGFRMPHEGPFPALRPRRHLEMARRCTQSPRHRKRKTPRADVEGAALVPGPATFEEAVEERDREYIRRLKELYWKDGGQ